ncbi:MAG: leucine-rich repeat domain-containing protein, partial [Paludibacteraceae bacterium]|nr:leucine-rich repeat domain-containing protein [Paludibacteraceae bacterium]
IKPSWSAQPMETLKYVILKDKKNEVTVSAANNSLSGEVEIPETVEINGVKYTVTAISANAFKNCKYLVSLSIPNTITTIGDSPFYSCDNLRYNEYDNANYLGNEKNPYLVLVSAKDTEIKTIEINNDCKIIGWSAFSCCYNLNSVFIPNSVVEIGSSTFMDCNGMTAIRLSNAITSIKPRTFGRCSKLSIVEIPNSAITSIGDEAFVGCSGLTVVTIPNSVTLIDVSAFYGCTNLTSIELPSSLETINSAAFGNCSKLSSINIPNSVTSIETSAFKGCKSLLSVAIPTSVTYIGNRAFQDCSSLTTVTIPSSVVTMEYDVFYGCTELQVSAKNEKNGIYCSAKEKPAGWDDDWSSESDEDNKCRVFWNTQLSSAPETVANSNVSIYTQNGSVVVENADETICVFDIFGRQVYNQNPESVVKFNVSAGMYIVKTGNVTKTVLVR